MKLKLKEKIIYIEESVIIVLFVCLFSKVAREYLESYYLCFLFIVFHELSHIVVASVFGANIQRINIRLSGLSVNFKEHFAGLKAVLIYLAGPLSNILLAMLFLNIEIIFEINIALSLINLVPIKPLDGYNILNQILESNVNKNIRKKVLKLVSIFFEFGLILLSIGLAVIYCNISLIILLLYIKLIPLNSSK